MKVIGLNMKKEHIEFLKILLSNDNINYQKQLKEAEIADTYNNTNLSYEITKKIIMIEDIYKELHYEN